jgi:hypothetical protein
VFFNRRAELKVIKYKKTRRKLEGVYVWNGKGRIQKVITSYIHRKKYKREMFLVMNSCPVSEETFFKQKGQYLF